MNPQIRHLILHHLDIDTWGPISVNFNSTHPLNILQLPFHQLGIIQQLLVSHPVCRYGIKHSIHVPEIIHHHGRAHSIRHLGLCIRHLPTQDIPFLLQLVRAHRTLQFYRDQ